MIDLSKFCGPTDVRHYLLQPWTRGEYTYATNGHIMVRVPRRSDVEENDKAPDASGLFSVPPHEFIPVPSLVPALPPTPCKECEGTGKVDRCLTCDGDGERECDLGHYHECEDCRGGGIVKGDKIECSNCDGVGNHPTATPMQVGAVHINLEYVALIAGLPGALIGNPRGYPDPVPFKFDGGDGLVMPMRP